MKLFLIAALTAVGIGAAGAVDFTAPMLDDDGKPMCAVADKEGNCTKKVTLGFVVRNAIDSPLNQQGLSPEEKDRRGELTQAMIGATSLKLLDSDVKMLKTAIGNAYAPSIVHQAWRLLDQPGAAATADK